MSPEERVGQLFMMGHNSSAPVGERTAKLLTTYHVGSVLLLGNSTAGVEETAALTAEIRTASESPGAVKLAIAADQEGGLVQRLQGPGFAEMPSAAKQSKLSDAELKKAATGWGRELRSAGVDLNLAPVADAVPGNLADSNEPVGKLGRGYGSDPEKIAGKVAAFIEGMDAAEVATAVKHFPGIGQVQGNTDFESGVSDDATTADDADLAGFAAAVDAGVDAVMMSTVTYERIDPKNRAAFSAKVIGLVRSELDFDGVVISDDLGAAAEVADLEPGQRATKFVAAGGQLVINADPELMPAMFEAVRDKAEADEGFAEKVDNSAALVLEFKHDRGLTDCRS